MAGQNVQGRGPKEGRSRRLAEWLMGVRVPETEAMDVAEEVETYDRLASQMLYIAEEIIARVALAVGPPSGLYLDIGTGTARIPIRLAQLNPDLRLVAVDYSENMLRLAQRNVAAAAMAGRITLVRGDAKALPYPDETFDMVLCSHTLHHIADPARFLREVARLVKRDGAFLITDLRRPPRLVIPLYVAVFGLGYDPVMKRLYRDSLRAAWSPAEVRHLVGRSLGIDAVVRRYFPGYVAIGRPCQEKRDRKAAWRVNPLQVLASVLKAQWLARRRAAGSTGRLRT